VRPEERLALHAREVRRLDVAQALEGPCDHGAVVALEALGQGQKLRELAFALTSALATGCGKRHFLDDVRVRHLEQHVHERQDPGDEGELRAAVAGRRRGA
jgi:hypothetical protein